jgi:phosphoribosylformylglycinamidine cyclo-ligase
VAFVRGSSRSGGSIAGVSGLGYWRAMAITYRQAGVDIDAGDELVERIKPLAARTRHPLVMADVGGFAGLCALPADIQEPILVSGTDGVGTKLKLAFHTGKHDTIGIDLVAMCVNDILTCGARPLFFLDYFATGKLDVAVGEAVVRGISEGCLLAGCALLGGETAEMPGMYAGGEYDLAGFVVGVVGRRQLLDGKAARAGDVLLGLPSSGLHSNGYSLARRVLDPHFDTRPEGLDGSVSDALLTPTRIYARATAALLADHGGRVHGMAHITGGGLPGNVPRMLPEGLGARLDTSAWRRPAIFDLIARLGPVEEAEMRRTFNLGLGLVIAVDPSFAAEAEERLRKAGEAPLRVGEVIAVDPATDFEARVVFG